MLLPAKTRHSHGVPAVATPELPRYRASSNFPAAWHCDSATMDTTDLLSIAEIAGIFVGFGALIHVASSGAKSFAVPLMVLVTAGIATVVGALIPYGLHLYGIEQPLLWRVSSGMFLVLSLFSMFSDFDRRILQDWLAEDSKNKR